MQITLGFKVLKKWDFNFIISKYMLTNVYGYYEINRLAFHIMKSPILSPLAKTAYLVIARIFFC